MSYRAPKLTPQQVGEQLRQLQALYGDRALPKPMPPPAVPAKPEPEK